MGAIIELLTFLFYGTGAVLAWLMKGRRTSLATEMSDTHKIRNGSIAAIMWIVLIAAVIYVNNRSE